MARRGPCGCRAFTGEVPRRPMPGPAGQDLDYSLDPFDDQSFYRSAARSRNAALEVTVGVSPKASRVWLGKANSIEGFAASAALLINAVAAAKQGTAEPFRFLATPVQALDPAQVKGG
ncbi:hypothetical protein [Qipengyuania citrea]|uniref:hypothetical protein n=2 Tax=Pseudomonadota TaxID=1224 RepID=UPI003264FC02